MKKTIIRDNIFETNSSSAHTFGISYPLQEYFWDKSLPVDDNGTYHVQSGDFGWGYEEYRDTNTKIAYAAAQYIGNSELMAMLERVIKEVCSNVKSVDFSEVSNGYIDHQSVDSNFIPLESLKTWLFEDTSTLVIDNDNH